MLPLEQRAAQYVRMSTEMQQYSIENQAAAIAIYAAQNGLKIVQSYEDAARSGLRIEKRDGLKRLLSDVVSGRADFSRILVYDVSRWGRFQDSDESAHYEFLCRSSGVAVEYCAELFRNDGSITAALLKNLKRAMAGEYSRELSIKVFEGQSRIVRAGFRMGSTPGFGLKRVLVDGAKNKIADLNFGDRKSLHSQHTILAPGNPDEISQIHSIYDLFLKEKKSPSEIARMLNDAGSRTAGGTPWNWYAVRDLFSNEKYIGNSTYNRASRKLGGKWKLNPKSEWVRGVGAYEAIVTPEQFLKAQERLKEIKVRYSTAYMLNLLSALWCRHGTLLMEHILELDGAPSINGYRRRFGSLSHAYGLIGYTGRRHRLPNLTIRREMKRTIMKEVPKHGGSTSLDPFIFQPRINGEFTVSSGVGRTYFGSKPGQSLWQIGYRSKKKPDIFIIARAEPMGPAVRDYYVLPYIFLPHGAWLTVSGRNYARLESFRTDNLEPFFELCAREKLDRPI